MRHRARCGPDRTTGFSASDVSSAFTLSLHVVLTLLSGSNNSKWKSGGIQIYLILKLFIFEFSNEPKDCSTDTSADFSRLWLSKPQKLNDAVIFKALKATGCLDVMQVQQCSGGI